MKKVLIQKRMFVYETDQYDGHADTEDDDQDDREPRVGGRRSSFLLFSRFEFVGLCGHCHAVFQFGVGFGLLFAVFSEV